MGEFVMHRLFPIVCNMSLTASVVILEALGGGGNSTTAGARIEDTDPESVRQQLIGVLDAYFEK